MGRSLADETMFVGQARPFPGRNGRWAAQVSEPDPSLTMPAGFRAAGIHCGIKAKKLDLALVHSQVPATAAGMFTQITTRAASVVINEQKLRSGRAQAVLVNSGNANACTGEQGYTDARAVAAAAASALGIEEELVLATSTGVIGWPLPVDKIVSSLPSLVSRLGPGSLPAARAIMTTDAFPKTAATEVSLGRERITIGAIAKGAGMIHPNMATMIAVLATDAAVEPSLLARALRTAVDSTFNCISVDGDTSTSDSVFCLANGASGLAPVDRPGKRYNAFVAGLTDVAGRLARMIVRDGEGAERVIEVVVRGARSAADARLAGEAVMTSVLVKTAFHGAELNWGRISAAVGRSGAELDPDRLSIAIGEVEVVRGGVGVPEAYLAASPLLEQPDVRVTISLGVGRGSFTGWTNDLGVNYVKLNSGYLT
jgi:glutamate N-acetyltransferase/amino-acid N-acetyltransferase